MNLYMVQKAHVEYYFVVAIGVVDLSQFPGVGDGFGDPAALFVGD